jgi:hypothetical protein
MEQRTTVAGAMASGSFFQSSDEEQLSLLELVDHVVNQGLVISGHITVSVADVDLIFVGLNILLGSVDTIDNVLSKRPSP